MNSVFQGGTRIKPSKSLPRFLAIAITSLFALLNSALADLNSGLVAFYPFNGNANDESGNGNHAIINNASATVDRFGSAFSAYDFNGSSSYIDIPQSPSVDLTTQFTLSAWIYQKGSQYAGYRIIDKCNSGTSNGFTFDTYGASTGGRQLRLQGAGTGSPGNVVGNTQYSLLQWHHVVATVSGSLGKVYLDGNLDGTGDTGNIPHNNLSIFIGRAHPYSGGLTEWFKGTIDDVRIYNRVLTPTEIGQLYNATPTHFAPQITKQPTNQTVNAGAQVTFSVTVTGDWPMTYQWRKNSLSISGATNATLTLPNVTALDSGTYSMVAGNSVGFAISASASLAVLTGIIPGEHPTAPVYPPDPVAEEGKDSLIFITHGRTIDADTHAWVDDMKTTIKQTVSNNWMVLAYKWTDLAAVNWVQVPTILLPRARSVGRKVGRSIMDIAALTPNHAWKHVHLIGHSAGAEVIEEASRIIRIESPPLTTIHTTFLDPYTGGTDGGRAEYGRHANWADNYYSIDDETYDRIVGRTEGRLDNAYNVDVTWLDPAARPAPDIYVSSGSTPAMLPQVYSSHSWPRQFYQQTIPTGLLAAPSYGFPMSKEGGGWTNFSKGNPPIVLNGPQVPLQNSLPVRIDQPLNVGGLPYATSAAGASFLGGGSFQLGGVAPPLAIRQLGHVPSPMDVQSSSSTSWLAVAVSVTSLVNVVSFESAFTGTASTNTLLTVYWAANEIGLVDQLSAGNGFVRNRFATPTDVSNGLYTLSFRLDTVGNEESGVIVTNVTLGYVGYTEPVRLDIQSTGSDAHPELSLSGPAGYNYLLKTSSNLVDWTSSAFIANETGSVHWIDVASSNQVQRFYRAVLP